MPKIPWKVVVEMLKPLARMLSLKWIRRGKETGWIDPAANKAPTIPKK